MLLTGATYGWEGRQFGDGFSHGRRRAGPNSVNFNSSGVLDECGHQWKPINWFYHSLFELVKEGNKEVSLTRVRGFNEVHVDQMEYEVLYWRFAGDCLTFSQPICKTTTWTKTAGQFAEFLDLARFYVSLGSVSIVEYRSHEMVRIPSRGFVPIFGLLLGDPSLFGIYFDSD